MNVDEHDSPRGEDRDSEENGGRARASAENRITRELEESSARFNRKVTIFCAVCAAVTAVLWYFFGELRDMFVGLTK